MKRFLALLIVWTLLVVTGTLVSADGQTRKVAGKKGATIGASAGAAGSYLNSRHTRRQAY